jgi:hemerythrin-like domain-containing protein
MSSKLLSRREFIKKAASVLGGSLIAAPLLTKPVFGAMSELAAPEKKEEVAPAEDLMREHGVLRRIILVYREAIRRITDKQELNPTLITRSAAIIRNFIEDYHEKLEENYLFPRFEKAGHLVELVSTLRTQHQAGRRLTTHLMEIASSKNFKNHNKDFIDVTSQFFRMYEPHAAREDTVLFPALRKIVSESEYKEMGEKFEDEEHKLFGKSGFEGVVAQIADIEKELNIYDLSDFTPK